MKIKKNIRHLKPYQKIEKKFVIGRNYLSINNRPRTKHYGGHSSWNNRTTLFAKGFNCVDVFSPRLSRKATRQIHTLMEMSAALHAYPRAWTHANKYIGMSEGIDKPQAFTWRERKRRKVHRSFLPELLAWQATRVLRGRTSGRRKRKSKRKGSRKGLVERGMEQQTHSEVIYLRLATGIDWFEGWEGVDDNANEGSAKSRFLWTSLNG